MEPIHRYSFIPKFPKAHESASKKLAKYSHIALSIFIALFFGIGFTEGMVSLGGKTIAYIKKVDVDSVVEKSAIGFDRATSTEAKGSDDKAEIFPITEYTVVGKPQYINAGSYLIGDVDTGEIILQKDINTIYPIASVSKLMTALVTEDAIAPKTIAKVSKKALATYGPSGGLFQGEEVRVGDLLYPLLLESSNDVAELLSEQLGEGEFAAKMNEKAESIGMKNTSYEEASGLSKNNVSNSYDLFQLAQYIYKEAPHLLDTTRIKQFSLLKHTWTNHNYFLQYDTFVGGKNGYTDEARRTTVSIFELPIKRGLGTAGASVEKRPIAIILLQTDTREQDVARLLTFIKNSVGLSVR